MISKQIDIDLTTVLCVRSSVGIFFTQNTVVMRSILPMDFILSYTMQVNITNHKSTRVNN